MDPTDRQPPSRSKIVFAALGAVASAAAIGTALYYGPPSSRGPAAASPTNPVPKTSERPEVRSAGLEEAPLLQTAWLATNEVLVTSTDTGAKRSVRVPASLRTAWAKRPVWVHVAASWCLPCLWELERYFQAVSRLQDADVAVVLAILDGDGDPKAGLDELLRKHQEILGERDIAVPPNLVAVADDAFSFAEIMDALSSQNTAPLRTKGIPLSLVFDRCGGLRTLVQNRHDASSFTLLESTLGGLASRETACP